MNANGPPDMFLTIPSTLQSRTSVLAFGSVEVFRSSNTQIFGSSLQTVCTLLQHTQRWHDVKIAAIQAQLHAVLVLTFICLNSVGRRDAGTAQTTQAPDSWSNSSDAGCQEKEEKQIE